MRKLIIVPLLLIIITAAALIRPTVNNQKEVYLRKDDEHSALAAYNDFLYGTGIVKIGANSHTLSELIYEYASTIKDVKYALFDMNGDNIPELHIRTERFYHILTLTFGEMSLWKEVSTYSKPLNNKAIFYERSDGAPVHLSYIYSIMDYFGKTLIEISFEKYAANGYEYDTFFFDGVEVSKEIWDSLTKPYLAVPSDLIRWFDISEEIG